MCFAWDLVSNDESVRNFFLFHVLALFARALSNINVRDLITKVGSTAGASSGAAASTAAAAPAEAKEEKKEAKKEEKKEEEEEEDEDMGFG